MISISTKELRTNFPSIVTRLKHGEVFLLIHNSVPLAEIRKPQTLKHFSEVSDQDIEKITAEDVSEDFLSKEEVNYYLSLK